MRLKRIVVIGASLVVAVVLGFLLRPLFQPPANFALGLDWAGRTGDDLSAFEVVLTNKTGGTISLKALLFEWTDRAGRVESLHASWSEEVRSKGIVTAYVAAPADAKKVRIVLCDAPGPIRTQITSLLEKLPSPLRRLVPEKWLLSGDGGSPFPWIANPTAPGTDGISSHSRAGESHAAVTEQHR